jgi:hypothetical protein
VSGDRLNLPRMVTQIPEMGTYYSKSVEYRSGRVRVCGDNL